MKDFLKALAEENEFRELDKGAHNLYNAHRSSCGRGGIGIRARLRGVSSNGYGFKSRRPHHFPVIEMIAGFYFFLSFLLI